MLINLDKISNALECRWSFHYQSLM
jgi:hypothetical protein